MVNRHTIRIKKSFSPSSKLWLRRQLTDEYVRRAKDDGYRCRSAYKLLEIHDTYRVFKLGQTVVDLGCCPGSWTQVAVRHTFANTLNSHSLVVGLDIQTTEPIEGATIIDNMDFLNDDAVEELMRALRRRRANVLLSDMAPNTTGNRFTDHINVARLNYSILDFVPKVCEKGATLVMKVFDGEDCKQLIRDTRFLFENVRVVRPKATRRPSSEMFYVGLKYKNTTLPPREQSKESEEDEEDYDYSNSSEEESEAW